MQGRGTERAGIKGSKGVLLRGCVWRHMASVHNAEEKQCQKGAAACKIGSGRRRRRGLPGLAYSALLQFAKGGRGPVLKIGSVLKVG